MAAIQKLQFPTETGIEEYEVFLPKKPSIIIGTNEHLGHYSLGKINWENLKIKFSETTKDAPSKMLEWINHYDDPTRDGFAYGNSVHREKNIVINFLDPVGEVFEKFEIIDCFPIDINSEILKLAGTEITIGMKRAFLTC